MDAEGALDVRAGCVRRSRVVRAPRCWRYVLEKRSFSGITEAKEPFSGKSTEVSRKAIAQGRPECSRCPVCSCAVLLAQIARETAGAASTRSSLCPLFSRRANEDAKLGRITSREGASSFSCHCERSEAIHLSTCGAMDCFAALAMTGRDLLRSVPPPGDAAVFVGWVERSETHHLLRRR